MRSLIAASLVAVAAVSVAAATAPAWPAATPTASAPRVEQLVVFRSGDGVQKAVRARQVRVSVRGRPCTLGTGTAMAALARSRPSGLRLRDFGACSSDPRDGAGLIVTRIRSDRNRGQRGWVYKVGRRAGTTSAADMDGAFGRGRLRSGQRITWFYCLRATDCQRTLELRATSVSGGIVASVRGYDDTGAGVPIEGASVTASGVTGLTAADGRVQLALPPGTHRVVARKDGLVRSFTERVEVP